MAQSQLPDSAKPQTKCLKSVDKALEIPIISSACSEVTRIASPLTPYVMSSGLTKVVSQVEEKVTPHIPSNVSESVAAAVERADNLACEGIDHLTEKLPQLKETAPKLLEETKNSMSSYMTAATDYAASFPAAQVALKMTDSGLDVVEDVLKKVGTDESAIKKIHTSANNLRLSGVKRAGTERAKKIEEASLVEALAEVSGLVQLMSLVGVQVESVAVRESTELAK